jgi:hypothetical protein
MPDIRRVKRKIANKTPISASFNIFPPYRTFYCKISFFNLYPNLKITAP